MASRCGAALKFLLLLLRLFCCSGIPEPCITENGNADIESSLSRNEFKEVLSGKGFTHLLYDLITIVRLKLEGYKFVCIYIKENIVFKKRSDFNKTSLENLLIEISIKNAKPIIFGCCYRPPETSNYLPKEYDVLFNENVKEIINEKKKLSLWVTSMLIIIVKIATKISKT